MYLMRTNSDGRAVKNEVCSHFSAGIAGSNPAEGMNVHLLCLSCAV